MYKMKVDGSGKQLITTDCPDDITISGQWIYYTNLSHNNELYKVCLDGTSNIKICSDNIDEINGTGKQKISDAKCSWLQICGNSIIYENQNDNLFYSISKDKLIQDIFGLEVTADDINDNVLMGESYTLPAKLATRFWLGDNKIDLPATWNSSQINTSTPRTYNYKGVVYGCNRNISLSLTVETQEAVNNRINNITNGRYK